MISKLRIQNFKCLKDVQLDLAPLTVLIGPNDSGKTSVLEALLALGRTSYLPIFADLPEESALGDAERFRKLVWRHQPFGALAWSLLAQVAGDEYEYQLILDPTGIHGRPWGQERLMARANSIIDGAISPPVTGLNGLLHPAFNLALPFDIDPVVRLLQTSSIYKLNPASLRLPSAPSDEPLSERGENLAAVLDSLLTGADRDGFLALESAIRRECPNIKGLTLRSSKEKKSSVHKAIEYLLAGEGRIPIATREMSDGVMLLTGYLALAYSDTPEIILLEEPENGLHPSRLKMIVDLLRKMTTGEVGNRKRQIILTTHSPLLLNCCQKEEVRIVRRNEEGATTVTPMAEAPGIDKLLGEFAIGELWYLLGEEGLLKGQRP